MLISADKGRNEPIHADKTASDKVLKVYPSSKVCQSCVKHIMEMFAL